MSVVVIERTPVGGSPIDITGNVILADATFESQLAATPGSFEITCKDLDQTLEFVTGDEITITVDGALLWGGYATQISRTYAFEADDTSSVSGFENRYFVVRGVDYNILFDKRVARNTANYLENLPFFDGTQADGILLSFFLDNYVDVPAGFDTSSDVGNLMVMPSNNGDGSYIQQGDIIRRQFEEFAKFSGAVWYITPDKKFHWHSLESAESRWGFSDVPNNAAVTAIPDEYQGALYGFREMEAVEDGSVIVNDALIWGGKAFTSDGNVVFSRTQDSASQSEHGRWQLGETHFNEDGYGTQDGVNARGQVIVLGDPGTGGYAGSDTNRGLRYPQWNINLAWFAHDVPTISGTPDHLRPGDLVTFSLEVFGTLGVPLVQTLPLRSLRISFPSGRADGETYVRFDGSFGLQLDDPKTIWTYILANQQRIVTTTVASTSDGSTTTVYGAIGVFTPTPATDGTTTTFSIPFGYIPGTLQVFMNGLAQRDGIDYLESDSDNGLFVMTTAPFSDDTLYVVCRTLSS